MDTKIGLVCYLLLGSLGLPKSTPLDHDIHVHLKLTDTLLRNEKF